MVLSYEVLFPTYVSTFCKSLTKMRKQNILFVLIGSILSRYSDFKFEERIVSSKIGMPSSHHARFVTYITNVYLNTSSQIYVVSYNIKRRVPAVMLQYITKSYVSNLTRNT